MNPRLLQREADVALQLKLTKLGGSNLMNPEEPADNGTGKEITFQQMDLDQIFEGYWDSTISGGFDWSIIPD